MPYHLSHKNAHTERPKNIQRPWGRRPLREQRHIQLANNGDELVCAFGSLGSGKRGR